MSYRKNFLYKKAIFDSPGEEEGSSLAAPLPHKQEGRIVCCNFDWTGNFLVTGSTDAVRVWDVRNGHAVHKMTTGRAHNKQETTVWAVLVLKDFGC